MDMENGDLFKENAVTKSELTEWGRGLINRPLPLFI